MAANRTISSWFDVVWPLATAATGVGYLLTAYTVSRWLTRPHHAKVDAPPGLEPLIREHLQCRTADGITLRGWRIEPEDHAPRATVVLFHGMRGNRTKICGRANLLACAGYRCIAFDHRAHGE